jgi:hypothetical protein
MDFIATEASPKAAKLASTDRRSSNDHKASALQYILYQLESAGSTEVRPWLKGPNRNPIHSCSSGLEAFLKEFCLRGKRRLSPNI